MTWHYSIEVRDLTTRRFTLPALDQPAAERAAKARYAAETGRRDTSGLLADCLGSWEE